LVLRLKQSRPDFLVETPSGTRFFLEMKSFEKDTVLHHIEATTFSLGHMTLQRRVNRLVRDAADQLQEYAAYGLPCLVALDNYRQKGVHLDEHGLRSVFGELQIVQTVETATGSVVDARWEPKDDNSPLYGGRNRHVRAVMAIIPTVRYDNFDGTVDDFSVERPMKVRIMRNRFATVPLPGDVFSDPDDEDYSAQRQHGGPSVRDHV
jgi:hypothetical protein